MSALDILFPNGFVLAILNYIQDPITGPKKWDGSITFSGPITLSGTISTKTPLTASAPATASVGVASAQAVAVNVNRKGLVLTNLSNNNISFGINTAAILGSGITLVPNGVWVMDEYTFSTAVINAIAGGAASNLGIQEFT